MPIKRGKPGEIDLPDDLPDPRDFPNDPQGSAAALATYIRALLVAVRRLSERLTRSERNTMVTVVIVVLIMAVGIGLVGLGIRYVNTQQCVAANLNALKAYVANSRKVATPKDNAQIAQIDATITQLDQQLGLFAVVTDPTSSVTQKQRASTAYVAGVQAVKTQAQTAKDALQRGIRVRQDNPIPEGDCG